MNEADLQKILGLLHASSGIDFGEYKDTTLRRRIRRRMALHRTESLADYARHLEENPPEIEALHRGILIHVTGFFRDPQVFEAVKHLVFPQFSKDQSAPIRIWVPGCSTGQEVYSLAMALLEFLDGQAVRPPVQIFGTDISDAAIQQARKGFYPQSIASEISHDRLGRFFALEEGGYRIGKAIRALCVFAKHNLAADPPFSKMDLVSCRNLLIYLSGPLQQRVIPTLHQALNPRGFLLLGASETVGGFTDLFASVDPKHRIYARKDDAARTYPGGPAGVPPAHASDDDSEGREGREAGGAA